MADTQYLDDLLDQFLAKFPLESLQTMSLEQYTDVVEKGKTNDSFTYWVESKTRELGSIKGGSSEKFNIYKYNKTPTSKYFLHDNTYTWYARLGQTKDEAWEKTRGIIYEVAKLASEKKFSEIDKIDELWPGYKWKIAFLYSGKSIPNTFKLEAIKYVAKTYGKDFGKSQNFAEIYEFLLSQKSENENFWDFGKSIWKKWNDSGEDMEEEKKLTVEDYTNLLLNTHNLILHGAPGTGKTHHAKEIAKKMGCSDDEIGFVQFHPSYDYTDFVEGLRPVKNENGDITFDRMDGVFKKFCKSTIISKFSKSKDYTDLLGNNPTVWKISLEGTGDNKTRTECMENNHIRIGWSEYGDIDISTFNNYSAEYGGSNVLQTFANKMKIGDIVLSCYTEWTIDAIGIVTSDYYYDDIGGAYPRYRDVIWIMKGLKYDIHNLNNNKRLTLASVYKLNISYMDVLKIIEDNDKKDDSKVSNSSEQNKKYVFIIDEINRGELSKIFGELFYNIDPGYRGTIGKINTQYQNLIKKDDPFYEGFYIPDNVYIIGTMNDIDRSVESMDFAFRRRFTFKEITAKDTQEAILSELDDSIREEAVKRMDSLNNAIDKIEGLSSAYHIGGAYFLKLKDLDDDFEALWDYYLEGLLREYLRGMEDAEELLKKLHKAYNLKNQE